jgi:hypothetical protein
MRNVERGREREIGQEKCKKGTERDDDEGEYTCKKGEIKDEGA